MSEREQVNISSAPERNNLIDKFQQKLGISARGALVFLAIGAVACGGDDSGDKDQDTATPFRTRVERTFTPTASPTEEATLTVTALPTLKPTPKPTTVYVPPLVTPRPTLRPTPIPTIRPTPKPTPTPIPLEVCNTGKFTNPVDGQTVSGTVDVKTQLAHNNDFSKGCSTDSAPSYIPVYAVVIDSEGRRYPWSLYCGFVYHDIQQKEWQCFRTQVILADDPSGNDLELTIDDIVVDGVELNY